jgi:predicted Fe-Mo cluster-binding NifX family protein
MKICIPTADDSGTDSRLYDHFGSAPFFAMADTESGQVDVIPNTGQHHGHGHCKPIAHIDVDRTDAVVCQGMGKRAFASLRKGGMEVWITSANTVRDAIAEVRTGKLEKLSVDTACGGHGARRTHRA